MSRMSFGKWRQGRARQSAIILCRFLVVRENGAGIDRQDRGFSMASVLSHVVAQKHHLPHISVVSIDPLVFTTPTFPLTQTPLRLVFRLTMAQINKQPTITL